MAFKEYLKQLSKKRNLNLIGNTVSIYEKFFTDASIVFNFSYITIHYKFQTCDVSYEDFPNLEICHGTKGLFFTKDVIYLISNGQIIIKNIDPQYQNIIEALIESTNLPEYSSPVKDLEDFNNSNNSDFKFPLTQTSYDCIPYFSIFEQYSKTELGKIIIEPILDFSTDNVENIVNFLKDICTEYHNKSDCLFLGIGSEMVLNLKHKWFVFKYGDYSIYDEDELDIYIDEGSTYKTVYIADQDDPPNILAELYDIKIYDSYMDKIVLEYDYEIFNPTYDDDGYEEDDSDESDDDDYSDDSDDEEDEYEDDYSNEEYDYSDEDIDSDDSNDDEEELCETDLHRIENESEYAENIRRENELNKRIREENPDLTVTSDGSYPGYYNQKRKIAIIGREDRGMDGADYNEVMYEAYKDHKIQVNGGTKTPSQHSTHRRILKYAKGLEGNLEYSEIDNANALADELGEDDGYSFAYVNASKASNMREDSQTLNVSQYNDFIKRNKDNGYLEKQMEILEPDLAVGMNLSQETIDCLGNVTKVEEEGSSTLYEVETENGQTYDFINLGSHLSSPRVNEEDLYNEALKLSRKKKQNE